MARINMSSIMQKVHNYVDSGSGRKKISGLLKKYTEEGVSKTDAGDSILTKPLMAQLANELINILKATASSYDLPESVMEHFNSLTYVVEELGDDKFECYIYFTDDLSRESLETDYDQGDGIKNIVALFNNGYVASAPKYGWWNGHYPQGESLIRSMTGMEPYTYVRGVQARPSLRFMQRAVEDFYNKYKDKYKMTVTLNEDEYDGNYDGLFNGIISKST